MKRTALATLVLTGMIGVAGAQVKKEELKTTNTDSPNAETSVTIGGKEIWIAYHSPAVKGRKVFGGADALQPDDTVWRFGADFATVLHTDADLDMNGLTVPKGDYTLYVDLDKGSWKLIVNKTLMAGARHIWGINRDNTTTNNPATELGRVPMTMGKPGAPVERFKITLSDAGRNRGKLLAEWDGVTAAVPFTVK